MGDHFMYLILLTCFATTVYSLPQDPLERKRAIGIFNVIQFPNDLCVSSSSTMNGTCYTSEECASRDGTASGSCANGYGVCCLISIGCGMTSSENCTYLVQASTTNNPNVSPAGGNMCSYKICPMDSSITRIRFDLNTFQIAGPVVTPDADGTPNGVPATIARSLGRCIQDTFTISGTRGPYPLICGLNTGQHMIVDTDGKTCVDAVFSYGADATRSYNIHVTQYSNINEMGGPPGCLQFYTGQEGRVESFNYLGITGARADNPGAHLQSHDYRVCIRPLENMCLICWGTTNQGDVNTNRGSFGVSVSAAAALQAMAGINLCLTDYVEIVGGQTFANTAAAPANLAAFAAVGTSVDRFCGRFFAANAAVTDQSVCTRQVPFSLRVNFDDNEAAGNAAQNMATLSEFADGAANMATGPFGSMGFSLSFDQ